jgi:cation-transporting ATPase F
MGRQSRPADRKSLPQSRRVDLVDRDLRLRHSRQLAKLGEKENFHHRIMPAWGKPRNQSGLPRPETSSTLRLVNWHATSLSDVADALSTDPQHGLDPAEASARLQRDGPNILSPAHSTPAFLRFLQQFHQPLIYILLAAAAVSAALGEWTDASVILGVVLVNAVVGYLQESKALDAIAALARAMVAEATVIRGDEKFRLPAGELVTGDLVLLEPGDKVPADLRLVSVRDLHAAEASLTGESVAVAKHADAVDAATPLAERSCLVFAGTAVTRGRGRGVVIATGDRTEMGRISGLMAATEKLATPLTTKIAEFSRYLLVAILALGALTFALGLWRGEPADEMFMATIALIVGAIPEGLPAAITIMLAIGVSAMSRRRAIIRKLPAVETLGSTDVICSDKTGTLTENQMTVQAVHADGKDFEVTGAGYDPAGSIGEDDSLPPDARETLLAGALCNNASLAYDEGEAAWTIKGDPTEAALLVSAHKAGLVADEVEEDFPRVDEIPFESARQFMATLHDTPDGTRRRVFAKGSLDALSELAGGDRDSWHEAARRMAARGLRVLAFACAEVDPGTARLETGMLQGSLRLIGLQGMIDPPREGAREAVALCRSAGIRVKMVTGDHPITAAAIARQLDLDGRGSEADPPEAVESRQLEKTEDAQLADLAESVDVFARVSPEQKLRLVRALQERGHITAMTGDGVNDAPALKQANIGIAMGRSGTDVAKDAADMVLTDDNFASIEAAVEEGRTVFANLTKFITWTLPTNLGEGLIVLAAVAAAMPLPVSAVQILWINMTTAIFLGLMLAFEPKERGVMDRPPRPASDAILSRALIGRTILVGVFIVLSAMLIFLWQRGQGASIEQARTAAAAVVVVVEMFYLLSCRSLDRSPRTVGWFSNPWIFAGLALMAAAQLLFTYAPFMNRLFGTTPLPWQAWLPILGTGMAAYLLVAFDKWRQRQ